MKVFIGKDQKLLNMKLSLFRKNPLIEVMNVYKDVNYATKERRIEIYYKDRHEN